MKVTKKTLAFAESILKVSGYRIRYEKGNFKGGYCLLEKQKIIVINKFFPYESQVNTVLELMANLELNMPELDDEQAQFVAQVRQAHNQKELFV